MTLLDRLRCALFGDPCPAPWTEADDPVLAELREHAERANREADALREARLRGEPRPDFPGGPSYDGLYAARPEPEGAR